MDKEVIDFFDKNIGIKHNKDIQQIPSEFLTDNSETTIKNFFRWVRHDSKCMSLLLDKVSISETIKEEIKKVIPLAISHRESSGWRSITLYGYSSIMTNSYEQYISEGMITDKNTTDWTDVCQFLPNTVEWIKSITPLKEFARIRIMILDPGCSSYPHRDYDKGQLTCGPINIAVINPKGSEFVLEDGGLVPWAEGDIRSMDLGSYHCIRNIGTEHRAHIIITPSKNDWDIAAMRKACEQFKDTYGTRRN